jgi:hypothetical protein
MWGRIGKPENRYEWYLYVMAIIGMLTSSYFTAQAFSWVLDHTLY